MTLSLKKPGTDLTDPKTMSAAKGVATRRNNKFRKMVEEKLPLFAEEMFSDFEPDTAKKVIERRVDARENFKEWLKDFNASVRKTIREYRTQVRELSRDDAEFFFLMRLVVRGRWGNRSMRWSMALEMVKRRREKHLSVEADLVWAWLQHEETAITHFEIWEKRGDGLTPKQILDALIELRSFGYADKIDVAELPERFVSLGNWKSTTAWTWEAVHID